MSKMVQARAIVTTEHAINQPNRSFKLTVLLQMNVSTRCILYCPTADNSFTLPPV